MALKFILSICVLMHLKGHVAGSSVDVEDCMWVVDLYPEEAKGFAEVDATKADLELAIESIAKHSRSKAKELTQCYEIRKVK